MTKSLDTDALRVSARDLSTAANHAERAYRRPYRRFSAQLLAAAVEIEHLRTIVEYAPHSDNCRSFRSDLFIYDPTACDCWKADGS